MIIPLTLIDKNPVRNAYSISLKHVLPMYKDGICQLRQMKCSFRRLSVNSNFRSTNSAQQVLDKWLGSEWFLYRVVASLGERIEEIEHIIYEDFYRKYESNGKYVPCWYDCKNAQSRQMAELMFYTDINRLADRVVYLRRNNILQDVRRNLGMRKNELDYYAAQMLLNYTGYTPEMFTKKNINIISISLNLYQQSLDRFFRRNHYYGLLPDYRSYETKPNVQRVAITNNMSEVLESRQLDLQEDRRGVSSSCNDTLSTTLTLSNSPVLTSILENFCESE